MSYVLKHMVQKAEDMGAILSIATRCKHILEEIGVNRDSICDRNDRLLLLPSNGVVEASDYLSSKHDWLQLREEVVQLKRTIYEPASLER